MDGLFATLQLKLFFSFQFQPMESCLFQASLRACGDRLHLPQLHSLTTSLHRPSRDVLIIACSNIGGFVYNPASSPTNIQGREIGLFHAGEEPHGTREVEHQRIGSAITVRNNRVHTNVDRMR